MLTAQSSSQTSGAVEYSSSIDSDLANSDLTTGSFTANFPVSEIGLNVNLTNASNFSQGQTGAQYSVTVTNGGSLPTSLPVTVTETLPAGLTLASMTGTGWTCTLNTSSCTRSDALGPNSAYPAITITVNVASNAPGTVTNQVVGDDGRAAGDGFGCDQHHASHQCASGVLRRPGFAGQRRLLSAICGRQPVRLLQFPVQLPFFITTTWGLKGSSTEATELPSCTTSPVAIGGTPAPLCSRTFTTSR